MKPCYGLCERCVWYRNGGMTDEELAEVLHNAGGNWYSEEYWLDWLKREYKE